MTLIRLKNRFYYFVFTLAGFGFLLCSCSTSENETSKASSSLIEKNTGSKPNIIVVYADDISAREFAMYKSTKWSGFKGQTVDNPSKRADIPVLTRIANEGVYVETAWAATVCSPSRAMMMTGRYASLHKWWHNKDYGVVQVGQEQRPVKLFETSPYQIGHAAQQAGYATIWAGKTQMGYSTNFSGYGFDEGVFTPGINYPKLSPHTDFGVHAKEVDGQRILYNVDSGEQIKQRSYVQQGWYWKPNVELMNHPSAGSHMEYWPNTAKARNDFDVNTYGPDVELDFIFDFMERQHTNNKPFFVYHTTHLGHDAFDFLNPGSLDKWPGTPVIHWDGEKYVRTEPNISGSKGKYNLNNTVTEPGIHRHIEYLDYQVWLYLEKLKALGIENDTVFIFTADNGTSGYGKHSHIKQEGTHVPFIVYAPGSKLTKQGKQSILVSIADILPTIADITGTPIPDDYEIHGESLWPYLTTEIDAHRDWIYAYKKDKTLIRGTHVMKDGNDYWWDVSETPEDLTSYTKIIDWSAMTEAHRKERDELNVVVPRFDLYDSAHDPDINSLILH